MPKTPKPPKPSKQPKTPKAATTPKFKPLKLVKGHIKKDGTVVIPYFKGGIWS